MKDYLEFKKLNTHTQAALKEILFCSKNFNYALQRRSLSLNVTNIIIKIIIVKSLTETE